MYTYPNCGGSDISTTSGTAGASPSGTGPGGGGGTCSPAYYYLGTPESQVAAGWRLATPYSWQVTGNWNVEAASVPCANNPAITYRPVNNWHVVEPNGTQHPLAIYEEIDSQGDCNQQTLQGPTTDGSGMYFNTQTGVLTLKNGVQIQLTKAAQPGQFYGGTILDPNGNEAGPNDTMDRALVTTTNGPTMTYTSPLGATLQGPSYTDYTVLDSNGDKQVYKVNYEMIDINPDICSQDPGAVSSIYSCSVGSYGSPLVIKQVVLPNNFSYGFTYVNNSNGQVQQVTLPTGASISYTYADDYQEKFAGTGVPYSAVGTSGVATRTVTVNGSAYKWTYNISLEGQNNSQTSVTDPLGYVTVHNFGTLCADSCTTTSADVYETSTTYSDAHSHLLRTITNTFTPDYDPVNNTVSDGRLTNQTITLDNGEQSQRTTSYDSFTYSCNSGGCPGTGTRMNPTQVGEYDYGPSKPGSLLRTTNTAYQSFSIGGWTITKPQSVIVDNGSGTQVAKTTYEYDNYAHAGQAMEASEAVQHSSTYGTSYTNRSNVTAVSQWRSTDGATLTTTNQYDDAGNVLSVLDPKGNQTSYSYTDSWSNGSCAPSGQAKLYRTKTTNALGQATSSTFNSCSGTVAATVDLNNQTTSLTYDLLDRVKVVTYPTGGGSTTYCYSDDPTGACYSTGAWSARETKAIATSVNEVYENIYDGLGRTIHNELTSDPQGMITIDTAYDGLGRVSQVSNPYRSTSESTYGMTTYTYDPLNRQIVQQQADGSLLLSCYDDVQLDSRQNNCSAEKATARTNVSWADVSDEVGHHWQKASDALGRLVSVMEPDPSSNALALESDYTYDALNNLNRVDQWGGAKGSAGDRIRTYNVNSLSQLISESNPESGTICYGTGSGCSTIGYDLDGNLIAKTDARGITTTYTYDALNRLTAKHYTDNTPSAFYLYDVNQVAPSTTYPVGHLVERWTSLSPTGTCPNSASWPDVVTCGALTYDTMGRITFWGDVTSLTYGSNPNLELPGGPVYAYDLAGNVAQAITYQNINVSPVSQLVVDYSYDAANRLNKVSIDPTSTGLNPSLPTTLFEATSYSPIGLSQANLAINPKDTDPSIALTRTYDNRLRNTGTAYTTSTGSSSGSGVSLYSYSLLSPNGYAANGNVTGFVDSVNGTANIGYDSLNRMTQGKATAGLYTGLQLAWNYDPWGNRTAESYSGNPSYPLPPSTSMTFSTSNKVTFTQAAVNGYSYDAAGNVINDGINQYAYDAEERVCVTQNLTTKAYTSYIYDGDGLRLGKATISPASGTPFNSALCSPLTAGYTIIENYNDSPDGKQVQRFNGQYGVTWENDNIYAGGQLLTTLSGSTQYYGDEQYYVMSDWLGTHRAQISADGNVGNLLEFAGLPFGNGQATIGNSVDATGHYFTDKPRDPESGAGTGNGNDFFGARYYNSNVGRFLSPDNGVDQHPANPQSWNLYSYVHNSPLTSVDPDGHFASPTSIDSGIEGPLVSFGACSAGRCPDQADMGADTQQGIDESIAESAYLAQVTANQAEQATSQAQQQMGDPTLPTEVQPPPPSMADQLMSALMPKSALDLALLVGTDGLGDLGAAALRVLELAGQAGKTADYATIAVTETKEGVNIVSSSEARGLRPAVQAALKPGEVGVKGVGHAEVTGVNAARQMGLTPTGVAASRGICPSCADFLRAAGVVALSALKATVPF